jgi:probable HAF family extracellular repeat protein
MKVPFSGRLWTGAVGALALSATASGQLYIAQLTSDLPWRGLDLNEHGEIVGLHAESVYYNGQWTSYGGGLGGGGRYSWSILCRINNNHLMIGQSTTPVIKSNSGPLRGMVRAADPLVMQITMLGSLAGQEGVSNGLGLNDANIMVGESQIPTGATHAVRFELDATLTDLGALGGMNSSASDINDKGDIVGKAQTAGGHWRAFLIPAGGSMIDLGTLGGTESSAVRINNHGLIIGTSTTSSGEQHAFLYADGKMLDLGTLGGTNSEAQGLNDAGVIVGRAATAAAGATRAFIKYPGKAMQALDSLVRLPAGWMLFSATAINNRGSIVALAYNTPGFTFTYLIKPGVLTAELSPGNLRLNFAAPEGTQVTIERATRLRAWTTVQTSIVGSNPLTITEPATAQNSFFRALIFPDAQAPLAGNN